MNLPTAPYRVTAPSAREAGPYIPWLVDKAVRAGRDYGYGEIVDQGLALILRDLGVTVPVGGFVDSDGRNARGVQNGIDPATGRNAQGFDRNGRDAQGFNRDGVNERGQNRDEVVEAMVNGWDGDTAAAVLTLLADRIA